MATLVDPSRLTIETAEKAVGEGEQQQDKTAVGEGKQQQDKLQGLVFGARYAVLPSYVLDGLGGVESVCKGEGDAMEGVKTLAGRVDELIAKKSADDAKKSADDAKESADNAKESADDAKKSADDAKKVSNIDLTAPGICCSRRLGMLRIAVA